MSGMHLTAPPTSQVSNLHLKIPLLVEGNQLMEDFTTHSRPAPQLPLLRDNILQLFQREQTHAMSLLDSSPFLSSMFLAYATGGGVSRTESENEELMSLRAAHESLCIENEKLQAEHKLALEETRLAHYEHEAEMNRLTIELNQDKSFANAQPHEQSGSTQAEVKSIVAPSLALSNSMEVRHIRG